MEKLVPPRLISRFTFGMYLRSLTTASSAWISTMLGRASFFPACASAPVFTDPAKNAKDATSTARATTSPTEPTAGSRQADCSGIRILSTVVARFGPPRPAPYQHNARGRPLVAPSVEVAGERDQYEDQAAGPEDPAETVDSIAQLEPGPDRQSDVEDGPGKRVSGRPGERIQLATRPSRAKARGRLGNWPTV